MCRGCRFGLISDCENEQNDNYLQRTAPQEFKDVVFPGLQSPAGSAPATARRNAAEMDESKCVLSAVGSVQTYRLLEVSNSRMLSA